MRYRSSRDNSRRALALLTAFCCFWMSTVGALQHNHGAQVGDGADRLIVVAGKAALTASVTHAGATVHAPAIHPGHCIACDWQANSVSPALPVYAVPAVSTDTPQAITTFPRYLRLLAIRTASRAPPLA